MGEIKDIEDFKHKIEKQQKLRRKTIKAVKEHFKLDDIELIEKELVNKMLVKDNLNLPKKVATETKFIPKVKSSIVARPIFKSNFERYDWHMKHGCISHEDRSWLASYIKSEEYKEIYEI